MKKVVFSDLDRNFWDKDIFQKISLDVKIVGLFIIFINFLSSSKTFLIKNYLLVIFKIHHNCSINEARR